MNHTAIKIEDVTKDYMMGKESVHALNGVSLEIKENSFVSISGTSGSGKSTLLHIIGGIDKATSGKVFISDVDISTMREKELANLRRDNIGFVFQKFCLVQELNVKENIVFPALLKDSNVDWEYVELLCGKLGLSDRMTHMPSELSGGQQQRVAIARALINKPKVILCDEPTGNLDQKTSRDVMDLLVNLHEELQITLVIVTHDSKIAALADEGYFLEDGKIV